MHRATIASHAATHKRCRRRQLRPCVPGCRAPVGSCRSSPTFPDSVISATVLVVENAGMHAGSGELDESRDALLADAADRARRYLRLVADRAVAPSPAAVLALDEMDFPLPVAGIEPSRVLAMLDDAGSPATVASAGPRYFGFVVGGALPVAVAASWLLAAWDQNTALSVMSPVAARLDSVAIRWVCQLLGLPAEASGAFVTGATMANAACLAAGRDAVLTRAGWDAGDLGLVGAPPVQVVVGDEVHAAVLKALGLIGLGRGRAVRLRTDDQGRILPDELPDLQTPAIVCLQAGNVNTRASDPFAPLIDWAHSQGAWVHVDGAFGLWAAACPSSPVRSRAPPPTPGRPTLTNG